MFKWRPVWESFLAVFVKEFVHLRRDRASLIAALAIPLFQLTLFGFLDQTVRDLDTVVVDQDHSSYSRELMEKLEASRTFKITHVTADPHEARQDIIAGRARVGIVIPPDFHNKRATDQNAKILVLIDGSDSNASAQALASVNGLTANVNLEKIKKSAGTIATNEAISAQPIILFNPEGRTANYIIPGLIAILLQIVALILSAVAIVRERERGTLEQLMVTPVNPLGLMLGKLGPYLIVGVGEMALILTLMRFGFDVPIRGSIIFLFIMAVIYMFSLLSLGLFISTRSASQAQAQQMAQLFLLPSIFLSGYIFPAEGLPLPLWLVGRMLPATHMIVIMRGVVLRNAGFFDLLPSVCALLVISTVLVILSARNVKKITY